MTVAVVAVPVFRDAASFYWLALHTLAELVIPVVAVWAVVVAITLAGAARFVEVVVARTFLVAVAVSAIRLGVSIGIWFRISIRVRVGISISIGVRIGIRVGIGVGIWVSLGCQHKAENQSCYDENRFLHPLPFDPTVEATKFVYE